MTAVGTGGSGQTPHPSQYHGLLLRPAAAAWPAARPQGSSAGGVRSKLNLHLQLQAGELVSGQLPDTGQQLSPGLAAAGWALGAGEAWIWG